MSTPIIHKLQEYHADDALYLLTAPTYAGLFQDWHGLKICAFPRKGVMATWQTIRWIRSHHFQRLYDLQSNDRTSILCAVSSVPERIGNHPRYPYHYHPPEPYKGQCHAYERLNQMLVSVGIASTHAPPSLPVTDQSKQRVSAWLENKGLSTTPFVLMHAGASSKHARKRWPYFSELAEIIQYSGFHVMWMGGKDDTEINRTLSSKIGTNLTGLFNIPEEIELGRRAAFAVTNDSAPMHILSCSGIPIYGLFGPTNWRRTHALGQQARVIALDKHNLADKQKPFIPHKLENISVSMVVEKLQNDGMIKRDY